MGFPIQGTDSTSVRAAGANAQPRVIDLLLQNEIDSQQGILGTYLLEHPEKADAIVEKFDSGAEKAKEFVSKGMTAMIKASIQQNMSLPELIMMQKAQEQPDSTKTSFSSEVVDDRMNGIIKTAKEYTPPEDIEAFTPYQQAELIFNNSLDKEQENGEFGKYTYKNYKTDDGYGYVTDKGSDNTIDELVKVKKTDDGSTTETFSFKDGVATKYRLETLKDGELPVINEMEDVNGDGTWDVSRVDANGDGKWDENPYQ